MSVTWDDTVSAGEAIQASWANAIIAAIQNRGPKLVVSRNVYGDYYCDGTADDVQIQEAMDALTAGRTYFEKVLVRQGSYELDSKLQVPDYTILEIRGKITCKNSFDDNMIETKNAVGQNIVIMGPGVLDGNKANQASGHGIYVANGDFCVAMDLTVQNCKEDGIYMTAGTYDSTRRMLAMYNNILKENDGYNIRMGGDYLNLVFGNQIFKGGHGIRNDGHMSVIMNNTVQRVTGYGLEIYDSESTIMGNALGACATGVYALGSENFYMGNSATGNSNVGAYVDASTSGNVFSGNIFRDNVNANIEVRGDDNRFVGNVFNSALGYGTLYCIQIVAGADNNIFRSSRLGNAATANVSDASTTTDWEKVLAPFVDGTSCEDEGWDVDANTEYARAFAILPFGLQEVIRIKIYAFSVVTEADAMRLEVAINAGADNEAYNTEAISVADKPSTSTNFAANDIIHWILTSADDSDIGDLAGGDSLQIKVLHEAAGGDDCATDARFRTVEIQYV